MSGTPVEPSSVSIVAGSAKPTVAVLDYGSGNVHSAMKALDAAGAHAVLTDDRNVVNAADALFVPGVGAFESVITALRAVRGDELIDRKLAGGRPVLGICVGMQVMFDRSLEFGAETEGLGQWPGEIEFLDSPIVPHMVWNTVTVPRGSTLFSGVEQERFYFVHSFAAKKWTLETAGNRPAPLVTWSEHGEPFIAAVENGPLSAAQFHPEKSGQAGIRFLSNWIATS